MDWQEDYKRKLVSAEEAVKVVKSGDMVVIPPTQQPVLLPQALAARRGKIKNVEIMTFAPAADPGWYQPGWEDSFIPVLAGYAGDVARPALDAKRIDFQTLLFSTTYKPFEERPQEQKPIAVFMTVVSPPDTKGYCTIFRKEDNKAMITFETE